VTTRGHEVEGATVEGARSAYLVRNPLSLRRLVYLDGQQAVLYRSRMNPSRRARGR